MPWKGWGTQVDFGAPPGATDEVTAWKDLKFNPVGIFDLRRRLGVLKDEQGVFTRYQNHFLSSDLAWFAAGCHNDGNHTLRTNTFHPLFFEARSQTRDAQERKEFKEKVGRLLFDLVSFLSSSSCHPTYNILLLGYTLGSCLRRMYNDPSR